ncbi:purine-nucleoside phosphorylase [Isosphaeraceae bacterium EP7]
MDDDRVAAAEEAASWIRGIVPEPPVIAIVLGSGLGELADRLKDAVPIEYREIPRFPRTTVEGHAGRLIAGTLSNRRVWILQGRFHHYEGHDLDAVTLPVRVLQRLGVQTLVLTAATGGIRVDWRPGQIVCLSDHLNLLGVNPLRGPNDDRVGPRFPDMTEVYSRALRSLARDESNRLGIPLEEGVYACLPGPSYETPAEIKMLRTLGADVVGMSTVPEAIVARHGGTDVLAFALVTNAAAGVSGAPITHQEVIEAGRDAGPRLGNLIEAIVGRLPA